MKPISNELYFHLKCFMEDDMGMLGHNLMIDFFNYRHRQQNSDEIHRLDYFLESVMTQQLQNEEL